MPFSLLDAVPDERKSYRLMGEGQVGILMLHGFLGSPKSSRHMAHYLHEHGLTVYCPLLPGHGLYPDRLRGVHHGDWLNTAEQAYMALKDKVDQVIIMGHSMGAVSAAYLIVKRKVTAQGIVLFAPVLEPPDHRLRWIRQYGLRYLTRWFYPHKSRRMIEVVKSRIHDFDPTLTFDDPELQKHLAQISRVPMTALDEMVKMIDMGRTLWPHLHHPTLVFAGGNDPASTVENSERLFAELPHPQKEFVLLSDAQHGMMRPEYVGHQSVWAKVTSFIQAQIE